MAVRCELCDKLSPERSIRCDCGYDLRTGEVTAAIEGAECEFKVARRRIGWGIAALVAIPVALVIGSFLIFLIYPFHALAALIVLVLASCLLAVAGAIGLVGGIRGSMTASRRLRQAKARKQLPAARVVK